MIDLYFYLIALKGCGRTIRRRGPTKNKKEKYVTKIIRRKNFEDKEKDHNEKFLILWKNKIKEKKQEVKLKTKLIS